MIEHRENLAVKVILIFIFLCTGGYYEYQACILSIGLLAVLLYSYKKNGMFQWKRCYSFFFFCVLVGSHLFSFFWATDKQMAIWGFIKLFPCIIFAVVLMQPGIKTEALLDILPTVCVLSTLIALAGSQFTILREYFLVNGRLAGTFQYPNTFAMVLLLALIYLLCRKQVSLANGVQVAVLIMGILLSGSRTVYIILVPVLLAVFFLAAGKKNRYMAVGVMIAIVIGASGVQLLGGETPINRIFEISLTESTFLGRLLYWKDAIPVILRHPLGLGNMGYYFLQGSFQSGVYTVNHVHNEFLQVFLDVGWIPGIAFLALYFRSLWVMKDGWKRLMLIVMGAHFLMDFDLQYIVVYFILMLLLPWDGREHIVKVNKKVVLAVSGCLMALMLYFSVGNSAYYFDHTLADKTWPKNTFRQIKQLPQIQNPVELEKEADAILKYNDSVALAWSAKARANFSYGNIQQMMSDKLKAIALSKYTIEEYEDYLQMLFTAAQLYRQNGDNISAQYCMEEALNVPEMIASVKKNSDPLAWRLDDKPELDLSEEYIAYLKALQ